tara:strand:+ start:4316 stop:4531 length:216 start_codon:yes stop_codon:yes gene_type:complete
LKKINIQFLKGGFNNSNLLCKLNKYSILDNFTKNEKLYAKIMALYCNSRNSKVTKWLRNIETFELLTFKKV